MGQQRASFSYRDPRRHLVLEGLLVRSLRIDSAHRAVVVRGSAADPPRRHRVAVLVIIEAGHGAAIARITVSGGYRQQGRLFDGTVRFSG